MERLDGRRVLLGAGGSVACYRALDVIRGLRARGAEVVVAPTKGARAFVTERCFEAISGRACMTDALEVADGEIPHVEEAYRAGLAVVAPASASLMARMVTGIADEALLCTLLGYRGPLLVAPAMESRMWSHPATQANARLLEARGATLLGPDEGPLASGRAGAGRMVPPEVVVEAALWALAPKDLAYKKVVVTAGPTQEDLDPVRFLSNRSSGKMGVALARAAAHRGAHVTLVHGPLSSALPRTPDLDSVPVRSAADMAEATFAAVDQGADVAILAAAVADYTPQTVAAEKLKKAPGDLSLPLARTTDILATLGARPKRPLLVGFAAETLDVERNARGKLERKGADLICANDVSAGRAFGRDENEITLVSSDGSERVGPASKDALADRILDEVVARLADA